MFTSICYILNTYLLIGSNNGVLFIYKKKVIKKI